MFENISKSFRIHSFAIITSIIIALLVCGYILLLLPAQTNKEDAKNRAVFNSVKQQLSGYIDDEVKKINEKGVTPVTSSGTETPDTITYEFDSLATPRYAIGDVAILAAKPVYNSKNSKLQISRSIAVLDSTEHYRFSGIIKDSVEVDLSAFIARIPTMTKFTAYHICQIYPSVENADVKSILSNNVTIQDRDSLWRYKRNNGPYSFKGSSKRYYSDHLTIPGSNLTLLLAAGVEQSYFKTTVQSVHPKVLIVTLTAIIILMLSISFIKPVISSDKERVEQKDLVSVVFSAGALCAVVVVLLMVLTWDSLIKKNSEADLEKLAKYISEDFKIQVDAYVNYPDAINKKLKENPVAQLTINKYNTNRKTDTLKTKNDTIIINRNDVSGNLLPLIPYVDSYFKMDENGLTTAILDKDSPPLRRTYRDRDYFQVITLGNKDSIIKAVFSRENNEYQLILAQKEGKGIKGVAFRPHFRNSISKPPGTDYLIVDKQGNVLMQSDPEKNLFERLPEHTEDKVEIQNALALDIKGTFAMKYQGIPYQVYAQKIIGLPIAEPLYVLTLRNNTFREQLSIFTFANAFLLSMIFGLMVLGMTLIYSALMNMGRRNLFSKKHFYYLFPDNSKTKEYNKLLWVNIFSILVAIITVLSLSPSIGIITGVIIGFNTALLNLIILNVRLNDKTRAKLINYTLFLITASIASILFIFYDEIFTGIAILFATHSASIFWYRKFRIQNDKDADRIAAENKGSNRRSYTRFISVILLNHFAVLPLILCTAIYVTELSDFTMWHCANMEKGNPKIKPAHIVLPYGCDCKPLTNYTENEPKEYTKAVRLADLHILPRPASREIHGFSLLKVIKDFNLDSRIIFGAPSHLLVLLLLSLLLLVFILYGLINYYGNRFFFYDLMEACRGIKSLGVNLDTGKDALVPLSDKNYIVEPEVQLAAEEILTYKELSALEKEEYILQITFMECGLKYQTQWFNIPQYLRNVLFDFARDNFVNHKNMRMIIKLMEMQIIVCDRITGRLRIKNPYFAKYIVMKYKDDKDFITKFTKESEGGFFGRLKLPIIIIIVSSLILLMYLNKDSYDKIALLGTGIGTTLALVHKLLGFTKAP